MPDSKTSAGQLNDLVAFDKRAQIDDGYGNTVSGDFVEQFQQHAAFIVMKGTEGIEASRLEGRQPFILRTRYSVQAAQITTDWQARDVRRGSAFNIRTVTMNPSRSMLEMVVDTGVATG